MSARAPLLDGKQTSNRPGKHAHWVSGAVAHCRALDHRPPL